MAPPRRLLHSGLAVVLALGLLSMHGLAAASTTGAGNGGGHELATAMPGELATAGAVGHEMDGTIGGLDPLHAIGQACLWMLVGGALLFLGRRFARSLTTRRIDGPHARRLERTLWSTFHHPPEPRLATVTLRC